MIFPQRSGDTVLIAIQQRFYIQTDAHREVEHLVSRIARIGQSSHIGEYLKPIVVEPGPHRGTVTPKRDIFFSVVSPADPSDHTGWYYLNAPITFGTALATGLAEALHDSELVLAFATDTSNAADELEPPARLVEEGDSLLRHAALRRTSYTC